MSNNFITVDTLDASKIIGTAPETKEAKSIDANGETKKNPYQEIPLKYEYDDGEASVVDEFLVEFPEVVIPWGVGKIKNSDTFSISPEFNENTNDGKKCIDAHLSAYSAISKIVLGHAAKLGLRDIVAERDLNVQSILLRGAFKNGVYRPVDKTTGELIPNRPASITFKLIKSSKFVDVDENEIPWQCLEGKRVTLIPLVKYEKVYVGGGKCSLQMKLRSAIVTNIEARGMKFRQTSTISRLRAANPHLGSQVREQVEAIRAERATQGQETKGSETETSASSPLRKQKTEDEPDSLAALLSGVGSR